MASKPTTGAEKALQKIQDQVACGICLEPCKQPRLLKCLHTFCEQCLLPMVCKGQEGKIIPCPTCRQDTLLPASGVQGLKSAFYVEWFLEIQDCLRKSDYCLNHPEKEADVYCESCDKLICSFCLINNHRNHQCIEVPKAFVNQSRGINSSLKQVEEQITMLESATESVSIRCIAINEQKTAVVEEIHTAMEHLRQVIDMRETELVDQAEQAAQHKLKMLGEQKNELELYLGQLRSFHDFVQKSLNTCSQGHILNLKKPLMEQFNVLTDSFNSVTLALAEQADMRFVHSLSELIETCQPFGDVYCNPVCPENCKVSCKDVNTAMRGQTVIINVETFDQKGNAYTIPVDNIRCKLVASDSSSRIKGTVKRRDGNIYDISYQPQVTGKHHLHILIEDCPILNSPLTVTVLPNLTNSARIIEGLEKPLGIAVTEGGEVVVAEWESDCVSLISANKERKLFSVRGSGFNSPQGVAIDAGGNILVADYNKHRIQKLSSTGKHIQTVGTEGTGPLQFKFPRGIAIQPDTQKVYIVDNDNHRIQVLNSDLSHCKCFGKKGSGNGEFNEPYDVSIDRKGNIYVADRENHRIQVFTGDGVYLRQFGKDEEEEGKLKRPVSIAVESENFVYIGEEGNNRVSIFSTHGEFIKSFGKQGDGRVQFKGPLGLAVDKKGILYVCDTYNDRIQIFF